MSILQTAGANVGAGKLVTQLWRTLHVRSNKCADALFKGLQLSFAELFRLQPFGLNWLQPLGSEPLSEHVSGDPLRANLC